jgi:hypothetical protein
MIYQTSTLGRWPYRIVRLACNPRTCRSQYRKDTLIARFRDDAKVPGIRHKIARWSMACVMVP